MTTVARLRSLVRSLLLNPAEGRPRMPWRLALAAALFAVTGLLAVVAASAVAGPLGGLLAPLLATGAGSVAVTATSVALVTTFVAADVYVAGRLFDRRRFRDFGFRFGPNWWLDFGFGLALGFVLMTGVFLVELAAGWVTVVGFFAANASGLSFAPGFLLSLVVYLAVGFYEELLARGYLLTNVAEGLSGHLGDRGATAVAVAVSSALFGLVHATNPNATAVSTATIALAGVFLALGYVLTGELALPIGLHIAWNFVQGSVYGFPVSGTGFGVSLVDTRQSGPSLFTGGNFGPEAGVVGVVAIVVGSALVVLWAYRRRGGVRLSPAVITPDLRGD